MAKMLLEICIGTSCHLLGSQELLGMVEALPAEEQEQIDLRGVTCLKSCGKGPNIRVNGVVILNVTLEQLEEIIHDNIHA